MRGWGLKGNLFMSIGEIVKIMYGVRCVNVVIRKG